MDRSRSRVKSNAVESSATLAAADGGHEVELLAAGQQGEQRRPLQCATQGPAGRFRLGGRVVPENEHPSRIGPEQPTDDVHQARLAGPVATDEADGRTGRHRERHVAESQRRTETFRDRFESHRRTRLVSHRPLSSRRNASATAACPLALANARLHAIESQHAAEQRKLHPKIASAWRRRLAPSAEFVQSERLGVRAPGMKVLARGDRRSPAVTRNGPTLRPDAPSTEGRHGDGDGVGSRGRFPERRCRAMGSRP